MTLDIAAILAAHQGRNDELHREHVNPQFAKVLRTIGFDRCYVRAEGAHLRDDRGEKYLDMLAGYGVFNMGRNHPAVRKAITDFLAADYPSLVQMEAPLLSGLLAEKLKSLVSNDLDIVYFTNSGAETVETAIKLARGATGRPVILSCERGFHGLTTGALALSGDEHFRRGFEPYPPQFRRIPFDDLSALEAALAAGDVAAFVVEPVQGKGVNIPSPGYLVEAAALCRRAGALFVADEVQTGMGRTGRFLALEHDESDGRVVDPDMVLLAKSLSGGYVPVGAVLTRRWIYDKVFSSMDRAVVHSSTFGQGSLAMVAGLAALDVLESEGLLANAARMGELLGAGLNEMVGRYELLHAVRQRGLMIGIELGEPRSLALRGAWKLIHSMDRSLFPQAVTIPLLDDHRVLTQVAGHEIDVVKLIPPLVIDEADVRWFLDAFAPVMDALHQFPGPVWEILKKLGKHAVGKRKHEPVSS
ncbi:MAG: aspartate aminotransferase family protein [Planctomycetota bacterium]|jgi:acetylornithine/succinyldiaminopimelate/putrescine aminotransferase